MVWPEVTLGHHAACCLGFNSEHPQLLVSGGRTCYDKGLKDVWAFNLSQKKWKHVRFHVDSCLMMFHIYCVYRLDYLRILNYQDGATRQQQSFCQMGRKKLFCLEDPHLTISTTGTILDPTVFGW